MGFAVLVATTRKENGNGPGQHDIITIQDYMKYPYH